MTTDPGSAPTPCHHLYYRESWPAHAFREGVAAWDRVRYSLLWRFWWGPRNRRIEDREAGAVTDWVAEANWPPGQYGGYLRCAQCTAAVSNTQEQLSDHPSAHIPALYNPFTAPNGWCIDADIAGLVAGLNSLGLETGTSCQGHAPGKGYGGEGCCCSSDSTCGWAYLTLGPGVMEQFLAATRIAGVPVTPDSRWLGRQMRWTGARFDRECIPALTALFPHPGGDWAPVPVAYDR